VGDRGGGEWERISWEEALDTVAGKLAGARDRYGAESVCLAKGIYGRKADYVSRLGNVFGTPNVTSIDNTCYIPSASARLMTYGFDGAPDLAGGPECVLCWGNSADPPLQEGAKLIVVNVLKTSAAERADIWLRPRPGTDLALALGMLNVIIGESLYDQEFVDLWTTGFERLERHVEEYPPERVAEITWVSAEKITAAARLFAGSHPGCLWNGNASEDTYNSTQCARAFAIIQAICGALDVPGGTVHTEGAILGEGGNRDILRHLLPPEQERKKLGADHGLLPSPPTVGSDRVEAGGDPSAACADGHSGREGLCGSGPGDLREQSAHNLEQLAEGGEGSEKGRIFVRGRPGDDAYGGPCRCRVACRFVS